MTPGHQTPPRPSTIPGLLQSAIDTLGTLRLQLTSLQQALLAPQQPPAPPSPPDTLLVPGQASPSHITDDQANTWQLLPNGPSQTPTVFLNGYPLPEASPATLVLWSASSKLFYQRITGQWHLWSTNHWLPATNPQTPAAPEWGPPARRAASSTTWDWAPPTSQSTNWDLLTELFTDTGRQAETFLPSPIPLVTRPRGLPRPPVFERSDHTFLLPIFGVASPVTFQFPGLRPTFIRLWDGLRQTSAEPPRVATGTDTIVVPASPGSFHIIELALG